MKTTMGTWANVVVLTGLLGLVPLGHQASGDVIGVAVDGLVILAPDDVTDTTSHGSHCDSRHADGSVAYVAVADRFPYIMACNGSHNCDYRKYKCGCRWGSVRFSSLLYRRPQESDQATAARRLVDFYWSHSAMVPQPVGSKTDHSENTITPRVPNEKDDTTIGDKTMEEKPSPNDKGEHKPRETVDTKPSGISPSSKKKKKSDSEKSKKDKKSDDKKSKKDKKLDNKKSKKDKKSDKKKSKKGKRTKEEEISDSFGGIPVLRPDQLMDELGKLGVLKKP